MRDRHMEFFIQCHSWSHFVQQGVDPPVKTTFDVLISRGNMPACPPNIDGSASITFDLI